MQLVKPFAKAKRVTDSGLSTRTHGTDLLTVVTRNQRAAQDYSPHADLPVPADDAISQDEDLREEEYSAGPAEFADVHKEVPPKAGYLTRPSPTSGDPFT